MEIKAKFSITRDKVSAAIYLVQVLEGKGGIIPVHALIGLLIPGELPEAAAVALADKGEFKVSPDGIFINDFREPLTISGFHIPGMDGDSRLELAPVVEGKLKSISPDGFEVEFSRENGIMGSTTRGSKSLGKGRHLGFQVTKEKLLIRTEAIEPVFMRGMKINMAVYVI